MDVLPVNPGHTLVIPRVHASRLADLPEATAGPLMAVGHRIALALQRTDMRTDGVNLFLADGEVAGQEVFHVHLHVIPRRAGDGLHLSVDYDAPPTRDVLDQQADQIRSACQR
jgi:histidine triad (HIT) family protein